MKKYRWMLAVAFLAVAGGLFAGYFWPGKSRINQQSYEKIGSGMTRAEVIEILGSRPHYAPGELKRVRIVGTLLSMQLESEGEVWESEEYRIYVLFSADGKATGWRGSTYTRPEETWYQRLRRWMRLPAK